MKHKAKARCKKCKGTGRFHTIGGDIECPDCYPMPQPKHCGICNDKGYRWGDKTKLCICQAKKIDKFYETYVQKQNRHHPAQPKPKSECDMAGNIKPHDCPFNVACSCTLRYECVGCNELSDFIKRTCKPKPEEVKRLTLSQFRDWSHDCYHGKITMSRLVEMINEHFGVK